MVMVALSFWYLFVFGWGIICAWAFIVGIE